jgi:hypothetical protein
LIIRRLPSFLKQRTASLVLEKKGVRFGEIAEEQWGTRTAISLPGGGKFGLYEPKHPVTFGKATGGLGVTCLRRVVLVSQVGETLK